MKINFKQVIKNEKKNQNITVLNLSVRLPQKADKKVMLNLLITEICKYEIGKSLLRTKRH